MGREGGREEGKKEGREEGERKIHPLIALTWDQTCNLLLGFGMTLNQLSHLARLRFLLPYSLL